MTTIANRLRSMLCPALTALCVGSVGAALFVSQPAQAQDHPPDITGADLKKKLDEIEKAFAKPKPKPKPAPKTASDPPPAPTQSGTGTTQTGSTQTGNGQTGNTQTGNTQTGDNTQTGNTQTGNTQTGTGGGSGSTNPPVSPGGPGFNDPDVTKVSYSADGQTAYHHYKDGHIVGWRGGKIVVWIAPVAKAAATAPAPVTPPAPAPKPKQAGPKDRPVGGGMYEKAGTAALEKATDLHVAKAPLKEAAEAPKAPKTISAETKLAAPVSKLTSFAKVPAPAPVQIKAPMIVTTTIGAPTIRH
jgi:hypothetical protein